MNSFYGVRTPAQPLKQSLFGMRGPQPQPNSGGNRQPAPPAMPDFAGNPYPINAANIKVENRIGNVPPEALRAMLEQGNAESLEKLLALGLPVDTVLPNQQTLLQFAVEKLQPNIVDTLLRHGADKNRLYAAPKTIDTFDKPLAIQVTPLMSALLRKSGGNNSPAKLAAYLQRPEAERQQEFAKEMASRSRIVSSLLTYGADPNLGDRETGVNPLCLAADLAQPAILQRVLQAGAKPNQAVIPTELDKLTLINTPLSFAAKNHTPTNSDCVALLLRAGENIGVFQKTPWVYSEILSTLAIQYPSQAVQIASNLIQTDHQLMDRNRIDHFVNQYVSHPPRREEDLNKLIETMLIPGADFNNPAQNLSHYSHLKSWVGDSIALHENEVKGHRLEGWYPNIVMPRKIKSLMKSLLAIENNKVDCPKAFHEPKEQVVAKLKSEIYNQVTNFFAFNHQMIFRFDGPKTLERMREAEMQEAYKICDQINRLKPGESLSSYAGFPGHAVYMEYKRQPDNNITRYIYNLGAGNEQFHTRPNQSLLSYPHVVENIPSAHFERRTLPAIDFVLLPTHSVSQGAFRTMYNTHLGGQLKPYPADCLPFDRQVAGNCSVHNNQAGVLNRLKNPELFRYLLAGEQELARKLVHIPQSVEKNKQTETEREKLIWIVRANTNSRDKGELEIYRFLATLPSKKAPVYDMKSGDRVAFLLKNLRNNHALSVYLQDQTFVKALVDIADTTRSVPLRKLLESQMILLK